MNPSLHRGRRALALLLAASGAVALGCDQSGDAEFRIRKAREIIRVLNSGSSSTTPPELTRNLAAKVRSTLEPVTKSGLAGEAAAAQVMVAEAGLAEAGLLADAANTALLEQFRRIDEIRTTLDAWRGITRLAEQSESVNFAEPIAALEAQRAEREKARAGVNAELTAVDGQVRELHLRAEALDKQADEANNQAGALALRADGADARDAVVLVRQSMWHRRTGDTFEFQADEIRAQVQSLLPRMNELRLLLAQAEGDIASLNQAAAELAAAQAAAGDKARELRGEADKQAALISAALFDPSTGLAAQRASVLVPATESAAEAYSKARSAASGANTKSRGSGNTTMARTAAGAAGTHWAQAVGDEHYLALLNAVTPALGADSSRLAEEIRTVEAALAASRAAAAEGLAESMDSYNSVGGETARLYAAHIQNLMAQGMTHLGGTPVDFAALIRDTRTRLAAGQEPPQPELPPDEPQEPLDDGAGDGDLPPGTDPGANPGGTTGEG